MTGEKPSWLGVLKQYDHQHCTPAADSSLIRSYIGRIEFGDISAYIVAANASAASQEIGVSESDLRLVRCCTRRIR